MLTSLHPDTITLQTESSTSGVAQQYPLSSKVYGASTSLRSSAHLSRTLLVLLPPAPEGWDRGCVHHVWLMLGEQAQGTVLVKQEPRPPGSQL